MDAPLLSSSPPRPHLSRTNWSVFGPEVIPLRSRQSLGVPVPRPLIRLPQPASDYDSTAGNGELSPSFDASFANSLSISPHDISPDAMDVSPKDSIPRSTSNSFDKNFFSALASNQPRTRSPLPPLDSDARKEFPFNGLPRNFGNDLTNLSPGSMPSHARTLNDDFGVGKPLMFSKPSKSFGAKSHEVGLERKSSFTSVKSRPMLPPDWKSAKPDLFGLSKRHTEPFSQSPVWPHLSEDKRKSDSQILTLETLAQRQANLSSPNAMDIDPRSPSPASLSVASSSQKGSQRALSRRGSSNQSGAPERLALLFADGSPLMAPPIQMSTEELDSSKFGSKKRFLVDDNDENGPNSSPLARNSTLRHRSFEKSLTHASGNNVFNPKRRPSHHRRPSLQNAFGNALATERERIETLEILKPAKKSRDEDGSGRPSLLKARRAHSVCDGPFLNSMKRYPSDKANTVPFAKPRLSGLGNTSVCNEDDDETNPARRVVSMTQATLMAAQTEWAPPFGAEADGKALPCFSVKDDGLMRIKPSVLSDLLQGKYNALIQEYVVVDCRFDYEYNGGHLNGAINLPTAEAIENHFLNNPQITLPPPSKSGEPDLRGSAKKVVLIFHCEFSAKRAPTLAKHLRSRDRALNHGHYPLTHYPELYVLEGGYAECFRQYPLHCTPCGYVRMDDPAHLASRHVEINSFRRRQGLGTRARSFTFGETSALQPSAVIIPSSRLTIKEEEADEHHRSSSNQNTSSPGGHGDSPCPTGRSLTLPIARRPMERATTSSALWN